MAYAFRYGDRPLDGLTVQRAVGRGGFGEVYYALMDSGKQVALKYLRENPDIELRGIAHVMNLKSPHLITVYDVRKNADGDPFVIMEYVSGPSLRDLIDASPGGMGPQKAAYFLCGIAQGLSYLHERGIVHRDLKPGNIFYDDGYVKIGDYGLSKHIACSQHSGQTVSVGTVHYMAPEIGSGSYSRAIDVYALGVILFEMLTGRLPFAGGSMGEILMRHLNDRPDLAGVPEPFKGVIARALAKNPMERFESVNQMVDAVRDVADIRRELDSFDPASLSAITPVPHPGAEPRDHERTMTTPHRLPDQTLDVRQPAGLPPLPGGVADRLQQKADALAQRIESRAARLEARLTGKPPVVAPAQRVAVPGVLSARFNRGTHTLILLAVTAAISLGVGLLTMDRDVEETSLTVALYLMAGTVAAIFTYFRMVWNSAAPSSGLARLAYGGFAALFMIPAIAVAGEVSPNLQRVIFAPVLVMTLCNWSQRIEDGRTGKVQLGQAVWPAILGLIIAGIANADGFEWLAAGVCGGISLLSQAAAAMWPIGPGAPGIAGAQAAAATAMKPASPAAPSVPQAGPAGAAPETPPPPQPAHGWNGEAAPATPRSAHKSIVIDAGGPSFVTRTANAGFSFLGKILLLAGLAFAYAYGPMERSSNAGGAAFRVQLADRSLEPFRELPRAGALGFLVIGGLFLVLSRRNDGAVHFLRGFAGVSAAGVSALLALSWGFEALTIIFGSNDWSKLGNRHVAPLAVIILSLLLALVMLFWPKPARARNTVVV